MYKKNTHIPSTHRLQLRRLTRQVYELSKNFFFFDKKTNFILQNKKRFCTHTVNFINIKKHKKTDVCQRKRWLVAEDDHKNKLHRILSLCGRIKIVNEKNREIKRQTNNWQR